VTANLQHLLSADELAQRKVKDNREALDFAQWLKQNEPVSVGVGVGDSSAAVDGSGAVEMGGQ